MIFKTLRRLLEFLILFGVINLGSCSKQPKHSSKQFDYSTADPTVLMGNTRIIGKHEIARNGRSYSAFRGIPYAEKPERFKESKPFRYTGGVLMAHEFGNCCPHVEIENKTFIGDEDCLYLNVYVPKVYKHRELLPVMVWFLPGGFEWGASQSYDGKYLMDEDVVLVTFNYRMGALGFFSTGDGLVPGNVGLKDQLLALKWIQQNIVFFGGHPHKVTLFGESAGAASVHFHVLSYASRGLFHNAISQSGSANAVWAIQARPQEEAKFLAEFVKCPTSLMSKMVDCLRSKTAQEIVLAVRNFQRWSIFPPTTFVPVIEPERTPNAFLTVSPSVLLRSGTFNRVPWIAGFVPNEGVFFSNQIFENPSLQQDLSDRWNDVAPDMLDFRQYDVDPQLKPKLSEISEKIQNFYLSKNSKVQESNFQNITNLISDRYFISPLDSAMRYHARWAPMYPYLFTYDGGDRTMNRALWGLKVDYGLSHFDEIQYLFSGIYGASEYLKDTHPNGTKSSQYEVSRTLVKLWTNFAKYSVPVVPNANGLIWSPVPPSIRPDDAIEYLKIDSTLRSLEYDLRERMVFWETLLDNL